MRIVLPLSHPPVTAPVTTFPAGEVARNPVENVSSSDFMNGRYPVISTSVYPAFSKVVLALSGCVQADIVASIRIAIVVFFIILSVVIVGLGRSVSQRKTCAER